MHLSRAGYYKSLNRKPSPTQLRREQIIIEVKAAHKKHPTHGYKWLAAYIRDVRGVKCTDNFIYKCCKNLGIYAQTKHKQKHKPRKEKDKYPNLIFSTWDTIDKPRQVVISDMTVLHAKGGDLEVTFYFDAFTKQILTYETGRKRGDRVPYIQGLKNLIEIFKSEDSVNTVYLHTDQGSVFASKEYNDLIKEYNDHIKAKGGKEIMRSMSRAGKPTDNAMNEALNGRIKEELYTEFNFCSCTNRMEMEHVLDEYVNYYNNERPCSAIGYKTPNRYYEMYENGELEKRDTFEHRVLNPEPKFVQERKAAAARKKVAEQDASAPDTQE